MKLPGPTRPRAFTLLEIVIAMTVFSMVMVSVMACWKCIIVGTETGRAAAAAAQRARTSMRAIEDALNNAEIIKGPNIQYYAFIADTSQPKFASLSFAARLPASFLYSGYFGEDVMRRVVFDVQKAPDNRDDLILTQYPILAVTSEQNPPKSITLARDVSAFVLEFWSPTEQDYLSEFLPTNDMPPMIRITLAIGHSANDASIPFDVIQRVVAPPVLAH